MTPVSFHRTLYMMGLKDSPQLIHSFKLLGFSFGPSMIEIFQEIPQLCYGYGHQLAMPYHCTKKVEFQIAKPGASCLIYEYPCRAHTTTDVFRAHYVTQLCPVRRITRDRPCYRICA